MFGKACNDIFHVYSDNDKGIPISDSLGLEAFNAACIKGAKTVLEVFGEAAGAFNDE